MSFSFVHGRIFGSCNCGFGTMTAHYHFNHNVTPSLAGRLVSQRGRRKRANASTAGYGDKTRLLVSPLARQINIMAGTVSDRRALCVGGFVAVAVAAWFAVAEHRNPQYPRRPQVLELLQKQSNSKTLTLTGVWLRNHGLSSLAQRFEAAVSHWLLCAPGYHILHNTRCYADTSSLLHHDQL